MISLIKKVGYGAVAKFGNKIFDRKTGELLGRAFIFVWGGRIHIICYSGTKPIIPVWEPVAELRYWRSAICFETREGFNE